MISTYMDEETINRCICEQLIQREVHACMSQWVAELSQFENDWTEELMNVSQREDLSNEALHEQLDIMVYEVDGSWYAGTMAQHEQLVSDDDWEEQDEFYHGKPNTRPKPVGDIAPELLSCANDEEEAVREAYSLQGVEPPHIEAYEFWSVSDFLGEKLAELGHPVEGILGHTIWGRPTKGQAIYIDGCICKIASDMEILHGQKNEWKL